MSMARRQPPDSSAPREAPKRGRPKQIPLEPPTPPGKRGRPRKAEGEVKPAKKVKKKGGKE